MKKQLEQNEQDVLQWWGVVKPYQAKGRISAHFKAFDYRERWGENEKRYIPKWLAEKCALDGAHLRPANDNDVEKKFTPPPPPAPHAAAVNWLEVKREAYKTEPIIKVAFVRGGANAGWSARIAAKMQLVGYYRPWSRGEIREIPMTLFEDVVKASTPGEFTTDPARMLEFDDQRQDTFKHKNNLRREEVESEMSRQRGEAQRQDEAKQDEIERAKNRERLHI